MLRAEVALAQGSAKVGFIPKAHAEVIASAATTMVIDVERITADMPATGTPVASLVEQIRAAVGGDAAESVHRGATSQDIVDTATMLIARDALQAVREDLRGASDAAATLAEHHRLTPMMGRTLMQPAVPTTFGLKAAGWMSGLDRANHNLDRIRREGLYVQLGGAAGTLARFGDRGPALVAAFASELGLLSPTIPWHTERTRIGDLVSALAVAGGATAKPARDLVLLSQAEVAEVMEGTAGRGRSSTMPSKRNQVGAIAVLASVMRVPDAAASVLSAMVQEHERAAGAWHAEWRPLREVFVAVGSAATGLRECLEHLRVDPAAMRRNLEANRLRLSGERLADALLPHVGRDAALDVIDAAVRDAAQGADPIDALVRAEGGRTGLDRTAFEELLDPEGYLGVAPQLVDDALRAHRHDVG